MVIAITGALYLNEYNESSLVSFFFLFGDYLEARTLQKTRNSIQGLLDLVPAEALVMKDGVPVLVPVEEIEQGRIVLVKTGGKVPVDGTVVEGTGSIDQSSMTGESIPVYKQTGDAVFAGTVLEQGTLQIEATGVGEDTSFARMIELVEEAQDAKSEAERFIDRFSKWYTPAVLVLALVVGLLSKNVELAITILVLGCPGALVIGVPVSNVAGIGNGASHGVLLKGSEVIVEFSRVDTIVFDKTGTLTIGEPEVADIQVYTADVEKAKSYVASIENESDHPLAKAVVKHIGPIQLFPVEKTNVIKGGGVVAEVNGHSVVVGNPTLMEREGVRLSDRAREEVSKLEANGNSLVMASIDGELQALIGIRDQVRPGVNGDLAKIKKLGVKNLVVLSGDNQGTVDRVAQELGLTEAHGHMLPEDKAAYIQGLIDNGHIVAFVGDGVNDSPSLALAHIGIAMRSGTDVAIETSDVVLMNSDFSKLPHALGLTKATANNMRQNIAIAVGVVLFLLASVFFSDWMNMSIGMFVHEGSILVVILNGMRLLRYKLKS